MTLTLEMELGFMVFEGVGNILQFGLQSKREIQNKRERLPRNGCWRPLDLLLFEILTVRYPFETLFSTKTKKLRIR